jgi:hypothetical protein
MESESATSAEIDQLMLQFDTHGAIEFKLDERTYRMIPLANSEDYMYKRNSLARASQVNSWVFQDQRAQFHQWYNLWSSSNVTPAMQKSCDDWLIGTEDSNNGHVTQKVIEDFNGQKRTLYKTDV